MFFLVFVLFLDCFFNMHLCAKLQPYSSKFNWPFCGKNINRSHTGRKIILNFEFLIYNLHHAAKNKKM